MSWLPRLGRRLRTLFRLSSVESSMAREMRAHIELDIQDRMSRGASADEARAAVIREFGSVEALKEHGRDARGTRALEDFVRDLAYAGRMFASHRAFSASAVLTFALGIGAATAIFSVVYGVLLRPLPYADPGGLVALWEHYVPRGMDRNVTSVDNFEAWRSRSTMFERMAALVPAPVTVPSPDGPERVVGAEVSPGYFEMLGVQPMLGRAFTEEEAAGPGVVVLSEAFWRTHLGADPGVIGRRIDIGGRPHTAGASHEIVGVMPADFEPPAFGWLGSQELWVPFVPSAENRAYGRYLLVVARLRADASIDSARDELAAIAAGLEQEGRLSDGWTTAVVPLAEQITGDTRTAFLYILAAVGLLLALAITNVCILLLARTRRRMPELGLRRALGATDARLRRQILTECLLLGASGCAVGLMAAFPMVTVLVSLLPPDVPRVTSIRVDTAVLTVSILASLIASLSAGIIAARLGRRAPSLLLREGTGRTTFRAGGRLLIVAEVAIGLMVAVLAGLTIRSFAGLRAVDVGFETEGVVTARVSLGTEYETPESQRAFFDDLLGRLRAQPGVRHAGIVSGKPFGGRGPVTGLRDPGASAAPSELVADGRWADAGFFRALGIPVLRGATFDAADRPGGPVRVVINASMARAVWPNENPVGRTAAIDLFGGLSATVIGVVGDTHLADARTPPRPGFYLASGRFGGPTYDLVVRSDAHPAVVIAGMRAALAEMDPSLPLHRIETLEHAVQSTLSRDRFTALLLSGFAAMALLLASVGIYGILASDVATRRKEIGIRLALGARSGEVVREILARALTSAAAGLALGGAAAALLARSMQGILYGVGATDAWSFAMAAGALLAVTLAATWIPAAHAARVPARELFLG
jgi:predicted permease